MSNTKQKSKKPKVLVVGHDMMVRRMFDKYNWNILTLADQNSKIEPDIICFTGGSDVSPNMYGEEPIRGTHTDPVRDKREFDLFKKYQEYPKVGICRGGQLLNVVSGGAMWQHVKGHTGDHEMTDLLFDGKRKIKTTSTHHQMMIAAPDAEHIAIVDPSIAKGHCSWSDKREIPSFDTEVLYYERTNSLCFQGHPEYDYAESETAEYFFHLIDHIWNFHGEAN